MNNEQLFTAEMIKTCTLETLKQKLWGAWMVLSGKAGIIIIPLQAKDVYREQP